MILKKKQREKKEETEKKNPIKYTETKGNS